MAGVTTPSQRIIAAAGQERVTTDSLGRRIHWRRLNALDRARLFKAVGPEQSANAPYVGMAMIASSATMIDDIPLPMPRRDADVESLIGKLGDEGMDAIGAALAAEMMLEAADQEDDADADAPPEPAPAAHREPDPKPVQAPARPARRAVATGPV